MPRLVLLLCLLGPVHAETLKLRTEPDMGKSVLVRRDSRQEVDTRVTGSDGKELRRHHITTSDVAEYTLAIVERKGCQPVKFTHEYTRADKTTGKEKAIFPWQGRKVHFELAEGKLKASAEGRFLDRKQDLEREVSSRFLDTLLPLLPGKEVKPGDEWEVPPRQAAAGLKVPVNEKASRSSGKLIRVYEKDGVRFGVIEITAELALEGEGGKVEYKVRIDGAIDGNSTRGSYRVDMTLRGKQTMQEKGRKLTVGGTTRRSVTLEVSEQK